MTTWCHAGASASSATPTHGTHEAHATQVEPEHHQPLAQQEGMLHQQEVSVAQPQLLEAGQHALVIDAAPLYQPGCAIQLVLHRSSSIANTAPA